MTRLSGKVRGRREPIALSMRRAALDAYRLTFGQVPLGVETAANFTLAAVLSGGVEVYAPNVAH